MTSRRHQPIYPIITLLSSILSSHHFTYVINTFPPSLCPSLTPSGTDRCLHEAVKNLPDDILASFGDNQVAFGGMVTHRHTP